jgi:uncharacterized protein with FMN-binding domain
MVTAAALATAAAADQAATAVASRSRTYVGRTVQQALGPVRVTITVSGKRMTKVTARAPLDSSTSRQINDHAVPILDREALRTQSVRGIHKVSGASLTTFAFEASLQNAMAQAHLPGA